jgi:hypothetical protein
MVPGLEPAPEIETGGLSGFRSRYSAGDKAEPLGFAPYCFLKALAFMHAMPL